LKGYFSDEYGEEGLEEREPEKMICPDNYPKLGKT
jgi:hypothetical protein